MKKYKKDDTSSDSVGILSPVLKAPAESVSTSEVIERSPTILGVQCMTLGYLLDCFGSRAVHDSGIPLDGKVSS